MRSQLIVNDLILIPFYGVITFINKDDLIMDDSLNGY